MTTATTPTPREMTVIYSRADRVFRRIVTAGALTSLLLLGLIASFLILRSAETFREFGINFITGSEWFSAGEDPLGGADVASSEAGDGSVFSIGPMILGSIIVALIAMTFAVPLAIGGALYIEFYAPRSMHRFLVSMLDLAAAIPSLIFGLWGIEVFTDFGVRWATLLNDRLGFIPIFSVEFENFGRSPFVAGCVLAALVVPITTSVAREVYSRTPRDLIDTCYALGGSKWGAIRAVVMPYGRSGVIAGAMLGLGRALGETVAIYLMLNLVFKYSYQILDSAGGNVASMIALKFGEATDKEISALIASGLVLFVITLIVNMVASSIVQRTTPRA
ncbi:MAG: phosphate ABC transporter permease subunit PstC [Ilumatobacteraceae bacterium]